MLRRVALLAIALIGVSFHVHGQTLPGAPVRPATPIYGATLAPRAGAVLIGQVVDAASGREVPRAIVRLIVRGATQTRVADDRGRFYFVDVPDADVQIVASKIGFFDGGYGQQRAGGTGIPLTVSSGRWFSDLRIELFRSAAISGIVSDEVNEPLPGVRVRAWRRDFAEGREQLVPAGDVFTDDDGAYRIFDLLPGAYILSVPSVQVTLPLDVVESAGATGMTTVELAALMNLSGARSPDDRLLQPNGKHALALGNSATPPDPDGQAHYAYQTEFYPGTDTPIHAIPVNVGPSEDRGGVHFQLKLVPTHSVSGVVVGQNGPVPNQLVRLVFEGVDDRGFGNEAALTITSRDGAFTLLNVPDGRYTLQAREVGGLPGATPPIETPPAAVASRSKGWGQLDLVVSNSDVHDVIVGVKPPPTLKGRILLERSAARRVPIDLARMAVALLPERRTIGAALVKSPRSDGAFEFPELVPAPYFVRVGSLPPGWSVKSVTFEGADVLDRPIDLDADAEVTITLGDRAAEIWGTARDARGAPAAGAAVLLLPPAGAGPLALNPTRLRETRAATSGVFSIAGLPPGDYFVVAIDDAQADGWQDPARIDALRAQATRVSVREAEQKLVDLRLVRRGP